MKISWRKGDQITASGDDGTGKRRVTITGEALDGGDNENLGYTFLRGRDGKKYRIPCRYVWIRKQKKA